MDSLQTQATLSTIKNDWVLFNMLCEN